MAYRSKRKRRMRSAYMINEKLKKRIQLYSTSEHDRFKVARRRLDSADVNRGNAVIVQERNRALPHASQMTTQDREELLPTE